MRMSRMSAVVVLTSLGVALWGCGGSSPSPTTPTTPAVPTPSQAKITVTAGTPTVSLSPLLTKTYRITFPATMAESAGLGANINYVRCRMTRSGIEVERAEIGSGDFITQTGNNRLNANQSRPVTLYFDVNEGRATGAIVDFNFTDDKANTLTVSFTVTF
jgi:hypothetical protein